MNNMDSGDKDQCIYIVEVQQGGNPIASYTVEAPDALAAINRVELLYGQPVTVEKTAIEDEAGDKHRFILAHNWHGYMFQARAIKPIRKMIDWQLEIKGATLTPVSA
jgi:hypothetical protein